MLLGRNPGFASRISINIGSVELFSSTVYGDSRFGMFYRSSNLDGSTTRRQKKGGSTKNFTISLASYAFRAWNNALLSMVFKSWAFHEERSGVDLVFGLRPSNLRKEEVHLDRLNPVVLCSSGSLQLSDSLIFLLLPLLLLVLLPPFS